MSVVAGSLKIAGVYLAGAALWILLSDSAMMLISRDAHMIEKISLYKGWFFVAATSALLYKLVESFGRSLQAERAELVNTVQRLRDAEARQSEILQSVPGCIYIKDENYRYTFANNEVLAVLQKPLEDVLGHTDADFFDAETARIIRENDEAVIQGGQVRHHTEGNLEIPSDERKSYLSTKIPIRDSNGRIIGLCGVSQDISEQQDQARAFKESEARLLLALTVSRTAVWQHEIGAKDVYIAGSTRELLGLDEGHRSFRELSQLVVIEDRVGAFTHLLRLRNVGESSDTTFRISRNGEVRWVRSFGCVQEIDGQTRCAIGIIQDVTEAMVSKLELEANLLRQTGLFERAPDAIVLLRQDGSVVEANESFCRMINVPMQEVVTLKVWDWDSQMTKEEILSNLGDDGALAPLLSTQWRVRGADPIDVDITSTIGYVNGERLILCNCRDVTDRNRKEAYVRQSEKQFRELIESSPNGMFLVDDSGVITKVNREAEVIFGYSRHEILGRNIEYFVPSGAPLPKSKSPREQRGAVRSPAGKDVLGRRKSGEMIHLEVRTAALSLPEMPTQTVVTCVDATDRWQAIERVKRLAHYDELTGLRNRHGFLACLEQAVESLDSDKEAFGLILLDLDRFRILNDNYGHEFGDMAIATVSQTIQACLGDRDILARFGGDEFAVLMASCPKIDCGPKLRRLAFQIEKAFEAALPLNGVEMHISVTLGACQAMLDGSTSAELLQCLDIALFEAKAQEGARTAFYSHSIGNTAKSRLQAEMALRSAVEKEEFTLFYQPILDLKSEQIVGAEALVRWEHPVLGIVPPDKFIGLAEETNLIIPLGRWVLREACRRLGRWQTMFSDSFLMSVNFSVKQFADANIVADVEGAIKASGINPQRLQLEITESILMKNPGETLVTLNSLRELGVAVAIDDFGTGYSSLGYIHRYPIDCLKVDRSFVRDVLEAPDSAMICRTIVGLAHNLKLKVVAEGVETKAHERFLKNLGCEMAQGYLYSKPVPAEHFEELLHRRNESRKAA